MKGLDLPRGFWLDSVDSTMEEAKRLILAGKVEGCAFVVANHQTHGRGTQGRVWSSPEGSGLYLSVIHLAPNSKPMALTTAYTQAAGVACIEALKIVTGLSVRLKPVNDLYVDGKKLGGILVESDMHTEGLTSLITGVGLNILTTEHRLDRDVVAPVALEALMSADTFASLDRDALTEALVGKICFWHALVMHGQLGQVERAWQALLLDDFQKPTI